MHHGYALVLVLTLVAGVAASVDRTDHEVLRVRTESLEQADTVVQLAREFKCSEWVEIHQPGNYVDVMACPDSKRLLKRSLRSAGLTHRSLIPDVQEIIERHANVQKRSSNSEYDYLKFNTFEDIEKELERIAEDNPNTTKLEVFGKTHEERSLYLLRVTKNITAEPTKPIILIDAGIHSREWISISTIMYIINELVENPTGDKMVDDFLNSYDFAFMPVLNPDGYAYTWEHDRLWRKNRAPNNNSDCIGVDLNRNWDYQWGGEGTSNDPCQTDYRGTAPFTELETQAARDWVEEHKHKIVLYINFHAYGQLWMTPYGYSTDTPSNEAEMLKYGKIAVDAIEAVRNTRYDCGPVYTTIYPASSISVDWIRGAEHVLIAYTVELPDKGLHGFIAPVSEIGPVGNETWIGIKQMLLSIGKDKKLLRTVRE